jgi:hypothetical protein
MTWRGLRNETVLALFLWLLSSPKATWSEDSAPAEDYPPEPAPVSSPADTIGSRLSGAPADSGGPDGSAPRAFYWGYWAWDQADRLEQAILYHHAWAARSDSIYRAGDVNAGGSPDSLPNAFPVPDSWRIETPTDPVRDARSVDLSEGMLIHERTLQGRPLGVRAEYTPATFADDLFERAYRRQWIEIGERNSAGLTAGTDAQKGLLHLSLPAMPSFAQSIFGSGKSSLSVSGSERISFGGNSRWFPYRRTNALSGQSKFPELDMKQELFLKLEGTIGDKVHVDIDQNSNAQTPLENRVKIRYEGYEDDVVRRVNLGNTSLSLPGTRYVSYGGRQEGLFGVSAEAQLGPVKMTTIASKQESEASTRTFPSRNSSSTPIRNLPARDYVRRKYFFLDDPNRVVSGRLAPLSVDPARIRLFKDDFQGANDTQQGAFEAYVTPSGLPPCPCVEETTPCDDSYADLSQFRSYKLFELQPDVDYVIHRDGDFQFEGLVVELVQNLGDDEALAASFVTSTDPGLGDLNGDGAVPDTVGAWDLSRVPPCALDPSARTPTYRMIGPPKEILPDTLTVGPWAPTHHLECRNFYRLGGRNIDQLDLDIIWDKQGFTRPSNYLNTPYLEITGIDREEFEGTNIRTGHDGRVDDRYIDRTTGILHFPQLRPFAPDPVDRQYRRLGEGWPAAELTGSHPDSGNTPEVQIYDLKATVFRLPSDIHNDRYFLEGEFRSTTNVIELDAFNIIEGSEKVTAGSRELSRGRDYDIDYELGQITIKESAQIQPDDEISVTASFAPSFGTASRTLFGASASLRPDAGKYGISSTWVFESKGNPDRRVRLGEEPIRTAIGELAGDYKTESTLLTNVLDKLPLYTPATRSQVSLGGALGVSVPNPNTKGRAYVDDFDGSRESRDVSLGHRDWTYPAIPLDLLSGGAGSTHVFPSREAAAAARAAQIWYSPRRAALRRDLNPLLEHDEGDDAIRVLEWWITPAPDSLTDARPEISWTGLTQPISRTGEDLSTAQFLDIWINDFRHFVDQQGDTPFEQTRETATLYVDIGEVSEDAIWWPTGSTPADTVGFDHFDSEDRNLDGRLDECADLDERCNEDTGLDGAFDDRGGADRNGDNWDFPDDRSDDEDDPIENRVTFARVNGTELNSALDSEDLNGDFRLGRSNNYFTYRWSLSDNSLVMTDVQSDFAGVDARNSWRRIRIPLGRDFEYTRTGSPDWTQIKHIRLWISGLREAAPIQVGAVEFIGNRWVSGDDVAPILNPADEPADESELNPGEKFAVSVVNNKDNGDIYEPAFELQRERDQAGQEFEGYLSLDLLNFRPDHSATCYRRFLQDQDYTLYDIVEFFTQLGLPEGGDLELEFFIRFGTNDGKNYYEYRKRVHTGGWILTELPLKELSGLKQNLPAEQQVVKRLRADGSWIAMRGRPSFTRVRQITLGVKNTTGRDLSAASVWVNELRLTDVQRNVATASQFQLSTTLSDLGNLNFAWRGNDADFLRVGQTRGTGVTDREVSYQTTINADRFAPRLQMRLPVTYSYRQSTSEPKFRTGSDLVFEGESRELNVTKNLTRSFRTSYSRSPSANPWLRYTLDGFIASFSTESQMNQRPTQRDTSKSWAGSLGYSFTTPRHRLIRLPLGLNLDYLPSQFSATGAMNEAERTTYERPSSDLTRPLELQNSTRTRGAALNWNTAYRMLDNPNVNYQFSSSRDLLQDGKKVAGVDFGIETARTENLTASYSVSPIARDRAAKIPLGEVVADLVNEIAVPLRPSVNWSGRFNSRTELALVRPGEERREDFRPHNVDNNSTLTSRVTLPVNSLVSAVKRAVRDIARGGAKKPPGEGEKPPPPEEGEERRRGAGQRRSPESEGEEPDRPPREPEEPGGPVPERFPPELPEPGRREPGIPGPEGREPGTPEPEILEPEAVGPEGHEPPRGGPDQEEADDERPAGRKRSGWPIGLDISVSDVTGQYTRSRSSGHSRLDRMPGLLYQLGLTRDLDPGVSRLPLNSSRITDTDGYNFSSGIKVQGIRVGDTQLGAVYDVRVNYTRDETDGLNNSVTIDSTLTSSTRSLSLVTRWPDLQITGSRFHEGIAFLERRFRRVNLSARYLRTRSVSGDQTEPERTVTTSADWSPLFSADAMLNSGMSLKLRGNRRNSETRLGGLIRTMTTSAASDYSVSMQHSIERERKIPNPFGRGQRIVRASIDFGLGLDWERRRDATRSQGSGNRQTVTSDQRTIRASGDAGYNFTRNVHGTVRIQYEERRDFKTLSNTSRAVSVNITATFQF